MGHNHVLIGRSHGILLLCLVIYQQEGYQCHDFPGHDKGKGISRYQHSHNGQEEQIPQSRQGTDAIATIALGIVQGINADKESRDAGNSQKYTAPAICHKGVASPGQIYEQSIGRQQQIADAPDGSHGTGHNSTGHAEVMSCHLQPMRPGNGQCSHQINQQGTQ